MPSCFDPDVWVYTNHNFHHLSFGCERKDKDNLKVSHVTGLVKTREI